MKLFAVNWPGAIWFNDELHILSMNLQWHIGRAFLLVRFQTAESPMQYSNTRLRTLETCSQYGMLVCSTTCEEQQTLVIVFSYPSYRSSLCQIQSKYQINAEEYDNAPRSLHTSASSMQYLMISNPSWNCFIGNAAFAQVNPLTCSTRSEIFILHSES